MRVLLVTLLLLGGCADISKTSADGTTTNIHPIGGSTSVCVFLCWHSTRIPAVARY